MKKNRLLAVLLCLLSPGLLLAGNPAADSPAFEHALWQGFPIQVTVPVGQERIVRFPGAVTLNNSNPALTTDRISLQNNAGFLYIRAKKVFAPIRLAFVLKTTGRAVLIDLSGVKKGSDAPLAVVLPTQPAATKSENPAGSPWVINDVTLMRYAITRLYAPQRLMYEVPGIVRTPMGTQRSVSLISDVLAMPLASWSGNRLTVTAVLLKNPWHQALQLTPQMIHGHFRAVSFYPTDTLSPHGTLHDRTTVFLISSAPFNDALAGIKESRDVE